MANFYSMRTGIDLYRYKVIVQVVMGEIKGQGVRVTSKCLWDPKVDNSASYTFKNESFYATAMVFGCYFE